MIKVELYTSDGAKVADVLCPPFQHIPMALTWGDRVFVYGNYGQFREVFACPVFTREEIDHAQQIGAAT